MAQKPPAKSARAPKRAVGQSANARLAAALKKAPEKQAELRRATAAELARMGYGPKAERYVRADIARASSRTASASSRQVKQARLSLAFGAPVSSERAIEARRAGKAEYKSLASQARAEKAKRTRGIKAVGRKFAGVTSFPDLNAARTGRPPHNLGPNGAERYYDLRRRKMAGEAIPNGDWHWLVDAAQAIGDADAAALRGSPEGGVALPAAA